MNKATSSATLVLSAAFMAMTIACQRQPPDSTEALIERNKALVRRWIEEGFNKQNLSVVDELFADSLSVNGHVTSRDGLKQSMSRHFLGFLICT